MAYLTHGAYRAYRPFLPKAGVARLGSFAGAAFLAVVAATTVVSLTAGSSPIAVAGKGDRLAAAASPAAVVRIQTAHAAVAHGTAGFRNDPEAQTTTVAKGASTPLSLESPYRAATK